MYVPDEEQSRVIVNKKNWDAICLENARLRAQLKKFREAAGKFVSTVRYYKGSLDDNLVSVVLVDLRRLAKVYEEAGNV